MSNSIESLFNRRNAVLEITYPMPVIPVDYSTNSTYQTVSSVVQKGKNYYDEIISIRSTTSDIKMFQEEQDMLKSELLKGVIYNGNSN